MIFVAWVLLIVLALVFVVVCLVGFSFACCFCKLLVCYTFDCLLTVCLGLTLFWVFAVVFIDLFCFVACCVRSVV